MHRETIQILLLATITAGVGCSMDNVTAEGPASASAGSGATTTAPAGAPNLSAQPVRVRRATWVTCRSRDARLLAHLEVHADEQSDTSRVGEARRALAG